MPISETPIRVSECDICGNTDQYNGARTIDGVVYCQSCISDAFAVCVECGAVIVDGSEKLVNQLRDTRVVCQRCFDEHGFNNRASSMATWSDLGCVDATAVEIECYPKNTRDYIEDLIPQLISQHPEFSAFTHSGDGSLNSHGIEFKSCPVPTRKLKSFWSKLRWISREFRVDNACGLHVHINMRPYITMDDANTTLEDVGNAFKKLTIGFWRLQSLFLKTQPEGRRNGNYCLNYEARYRGTTLADVIAHDGVWLVNAWYGYVDRTHQTPTLRTVRDCRRDAHDNTRYTWMNLNSIIARNTVECRIHTGTVNATKIRVWCSILGKLVRHVMEADMDYLVNDFDATKLDSILNAEEKRYLKSRIEKFNAGETLDLSSAVGFGRIQGAQ